MGFMYSSLQCPKGKCYKKVPFMMLNELKHPTQTPSQLKQKLETRFGRHVATFTEEDAKEILECLGISYDDEQFNIQDEAHQHVIQGAMCCDAEMLDDSFAGLMAAKGADANREGMVRPMYENGIFTGYQMCEGVETGCIPISPTIACRMSKTMMDEMGNNQVSEKKTFVSVDDMYPLCVTNNCPHSRNPDDVWCENRHLFAQPETAEDVEAVSRMYVSNEPISNQLMLAASPPIPFVSSSQPLMDREQLKIASQLPIPSGRISAPLPQRETIVVPAAEEILPSIPSLSVPSPTPSTPTTFAALIPTVDVPVEGSTRSITIVPSSNPAIVNEISAVPEETTLPSAPVGEVPVSAIVPSTDIPSATVISASTPETIVEETAEEATVELNDATLEEVAAEFSAISPTPQSTVSPTVQSPTLPVVTVDDGSYYSQTINIINRYRKTTTFLIFLVFAIIVFFMMRDESNQKKTLSVKKE